MTLYRAIPANNDHQFPKFYPHLDTRRIPGNVPYLVDNLWEWLRPEGRPSRRHAAYASPTPALALAAAAPRPEDQAHYVVTTVTFPGHHAMAQLPVADARFHGDTRILPKLLNVALGLRWPELNDAQRLRLTALYLPASSREDVNSAMLELPEATRQEVVALSTFWQDATLIHPDQHAFEHPEGELFFQAHDGYKLTLFQSG